MAHQAHNLPWGNIASNFKYSPGNRRHHGVTNLFPLNKTTQGGQLTHFANVFEKTIEGYSQSERSKYQDEYKAPDPSDIIISPASAKKIEATVKRYRSANLWHHCGHPCGVKSRTDGRFGCACSLSLDERRMSLWIDSYSNCRTRCCSTIEYHHDVIELLKTLLLYNEMEVLLRIASHPDVALDNMWWSFPYDIYAEYGWAGIMRSALMAYICLNTLYLKPETYEPKLRKEHIKSIKQVDSRIVVDEEMDYRSTKCYQMMLVHCTHKSRFDAYTYPHRQFFGITSNTYQLFRLGDPQFTFGTSSLDRYRGPESNTYIAAQSDVDLVRGYLISKGLPMELSLIVMEFADYVPQRRLIVADDPLHPDNGEELQKYLNYCWKLLARIDMLAKACGRRIDWIGEVTQCIYDLWGVADGTMVIQGGDAGWPDDFRTWKGNELERHWIKFK